MIDYMIIKHYIIKILELHLLIIKLIIDKKNIIIIQIIQKMKKIFDHYNINTKTSNEIPGLMNNFRLIKHNNRQFNIINNQNLK